MESFCFSLQEVEALLSLICKTADRLTDGTLADVLSDEEEAVLEKLRTARSEMCEEPYVGDLSAMWTVALAEQEVGFETREAAESFVKYLQEHFPDVHFALHPPTKGETQP